MDQDMTLRGLRVHIRFSLQEEVPSSRWIVECKNAVQLTNYCGGTVRVSPHPGNSVMEAINRSVVRLGIQRVGIDLKQDSEDKVILTGFGKYYKMYKQRGWPIPDLDNDMTEFLSRFSFVVFLITRTVLLSTAFLYNPGHPEFPGVNFARVVKSCPSQAVSLTNRKCIVIYTSDENLGTPQKPIFLYDLDILDEDPDFDFLRRFSNTYDACVTESRNRGEDLPQLIYGHDDGPETEAQLNGVDHSDDGSSDDFML